MDEVTASKISTILDMQFKIAVLKVKGKVSESEFYISNKFLEAWKIELRGE